MLKNIPVALKYRDQEGTPSRLFEPDILLPYFQRYRSARGVRGKRLFREAQEWLISQEETGAFSFVVVCRALGFDPDYIRENLSV